MKISIIAAMSENRVIGKNNKLPWNLPGDLKRFKELTLNNTVIMGRKTFESIGKVLPSRDNIILSRTSTSIPGCTVVNGMEKAFQVVSPTKTVFIIGGEDIYRQTINLSTFIYLTVVHVTIDGDAYFPDFSKDKFEEIERKRVEFDPPYTYLLYKRKV